MNELDAADVAAHHHLREPVLAEANCMQRVRQDLWGCLALALALALAPEIAHAQREDSALGTSASGLRGLVATGLPLSRSEFNVSAAAGYGFTEPLEPDPGAHHRTQGVLGVALAPLPWLAFALRVDGRLELHPDDGRGAHSAGFGDPRLLVRAGHALSSALSLGIELVAWLPGHDAPSLDPAATTADARALLAFTPDAPWVLLLAAGYRLDNSAAVAPDLSRLRRGDRITLGLSDSDAVLAAVGLARRFGAQAEAFAELSADLLIGERAPDLSESPLRAALGGRYFVSNAVQAELTVIASLSQRPAIEPDDPLVPIEPRVMVLAALRYSLDLAEAERPRVAAERAQPEPSAEPPARAPQSAAVAGTIVDDRGEPLPEAKVTLRAPDGAEHETITDASGRYEFTGVPLGPAELEADATGFEIQRWTVEVQPGATAGAPRALAPKADVGVLRGLVRSFDSTPLRAKIEVRVGRGKSKAVTESGEDGRFELELAPGRYRVTISAPGHRPQSRNVRVDQNGVAILNVDMREH